ncbi:MAG: PIN domain nuclease [bacterium]|nr:PIN domain nuclease [bacterium]
MILVDTSVLIHYLKEVEDEATQQFREIMDKQIPFGINHYIYQELLQGCRSGRDFKLLKKYLDGQTFFDLKNGRKSYAEAAELYFKLRKKGITIRSTIDCLIAQTAIENDLYLLHKDADFTRIADHYPLKIWDV